MLRYYPRGDTLLGELVIRPVITEGVFAFKCKPLYAAGRDEERENAGDEVSLIGI